MKARRGVTLVEVMLAGSIAVLLTLACLEGVIVSTRIAHENSQLLAAEAYAWDTAWRWPNKPYDELNNSTSPKFYPDAGYSVVSSNDCPMLCKELNGGSDAKLYVRVQLLTGSAAPVRHGEAAAVKRIDVDVEWGRTTSRRRRDSLSTCGRRVSIPVSACRWQRDRGI